jgi:hypothetical protein
LGGDVAVLAILAVCDLQAEADFVPHVFFDNVNLLFIIHDFPQMKPIFANFFESSIMLSKIKKRFFEMLTAGSEYAFFERQSMASQKSMIFEMVSGRCQ